MENGYKAFYNGKETDIYASGLYPAKLKAIEFFKPRKSQEHMVHVYLCELQGKQIITTPDL